MQKNLEVFYGEDDNKKITFCIQIFGQLQKQFKVSQDAEIDIIFFKAINRVLNDDFKKSPELTRYALQIIHLIFTQVSYEKKFELITENSIDNFQWTTAKIFVWEFKRLNRIFKKYTELKNIKDDHSQTIRTMNINIAKQCRIFTLLILIMREQYLLLCDQEIENADVKQNEFKINLINFNLVQYIIRLLDYDDFTLINTILNFILEIQNEQISIELINRGILKRLKRFLFTNSYPQVYQFLYRAFCSKQVREILTQHKYIIQGVIKALEKKQIANSLVLLNLLSLDKNLVDVMYENELHFYLLNLVNVFFKKDDEIVLKKKILWNLLINLSKNFEFSNKFLKFKNFNLFTDLLFRSQELSVLKFFENCLYFCEDLEIKKQFCQYSEQFSSLLDQYTNLTPQQISSVIYILSEIYNLKERKPLTLMMKILKDPQAHPNIYIATFNFLCKSLNSFIQPQNLVNKSVQDYSLKKFFQPNLFLEDEVKFQFMFFLHSLIVLRNEEINFEKFQEFADSIQNKNIRYLALVMNIFDAFMLQNSHSIDQINFIRERKLEIFGENLEFLNQNFQNENQLCEQISLA